jgi:hypothetical protein
LVLDIVSFNVPEATVCGSAFEVWALSEANTLGPATSSSSPAMVAMATLRHEENVVCSA